MINPWLAIGLVIVVLMASMAALSTLARHSGASSESTRKLLHIEMGVVTFSFPWLFAEALPVLLLAAASIAWFHALRTLAPLAACFGAVLEARHESKGEVWFACGVCLAFLCAAGDTAAYCTAILVLTFADSIAALVGTRWGRSRRVFGGARKSLAGSAAFCAVAFATALVVSVALGSGDWVSALLPATLVALVTTLVEALLGRGLDNLFIPLAAIAALEFAAASPSLVPGALGYGITALALIMQMSRPCAR